jgi:hypothetical protein
VGRRRVEEALERGAGEGRWAQVGHWRRRGTARLLLLLGVRWARLGRAAGRVWVAAGGHGGDGGGGGKRKIGSRWGWGNWGLGKLGFGEPLALHMSISNGTATGSVLDGQDLCLSIHISKCL